MHSYKQARKQQAAEQRRPHTNEKQVIERANNHTDEQTSTKQTHTHTHTNKRIPKETND